jgi:uncharacterized protein (DUF58 family)
MRLPRTLQVTRLGQVYIVLTLGVGIGALNTGNNLLYLVLGFLLAIIVLSGVLSERVVADLAVRRLLPEGAFSGERFALRYEVRRKQGRAFALRLSEDDAALPGWAWVPIVEAGTPVVTRADLTAPRRGPWPLKAVRVTTAFPFGLFEKTRVLELPETLLVYPRRGFVCEAPVADDGRRSGDLGSAKHRDGAGDLLGLKELGDLEDVRRVHWRKSAAAGRLLKVEREREDRREYTLVIDPGLPPEALDRACEETAAVTHVLLERGHEVALQAGAHRLRPGNGAGHEHRILSALAWLGFEERAP